MLYPWLLSGLSAGLVPGAAANPLLLPRALPAIKEHFGENPNANQLFAAPPTNGRVIDRAGWTVTCDSENAGNECAKAIDGDNGTFWHTQWTGANPPPPHTITLDMGSTHNVNGISVLPRQDGNQHGWIARHEVAVSPDGNNWEVMAVGNWPLDGLTKYANFETRKVRYARVKALTEIGGNPWTSVAELGVFDAGAEPTAYVAGKGRWGPTINFPTVPVAGMVDPLSGKVIIWSAYAYNNYLGSSFDRVFTSSWDPATNDVEPKIVDDTDHDMFCPGISMDGKGRVVVTGGNSKYKTTLYDFPSQKWIAGPDMKVPRGYQSSATCSDGRVFTIGGSWSGGEVEPKDGEIYDPRSNAWTALPGAKVANLLTRDAQGVYRSDNHAWLFGWRNGSVFQAGPSTAMNWYTTGSGGGGVQPAGKRTSNRGDDPDSMCGIAVMYDATQGAILTAGGSPSYQNSPAHASAHLITLGNVGAEPAVRFASNGMWSPRAFATATVLPDGRTFITGGQAYAVPFEDTTPQLTPEMYDPARDTFYQQAANSIPRNYHSVSLLLPDGRVLSAGGGLCGDCTTNHFDGQVFTPGYLLNDDGSEATRPVISSASANGGRLTIVTGGAIASAALMRVGTSTHTVNTDQRRGPLTLNKRSNTLYSANLPTDPGVLLPGYWMLFVMNSKGVPSVSKIINLSL
ncbi:galactose oxidase precursor [Cordyceps fumosorosea ARSEF 2679]|uniref:Galactose oxidase n=1 Tax=Cordyceps fumosorosea (strain ARSEF 2679) TaxID=1081104 RepID=A0A168E041_CORFA|nr:galactose oxidase precursor [Cordyceps fumosorosea ARSEF 2679]OAA73213.1 galactose oxidase precursor [Cordyceps fumosorosea ARSEF 2679]